MTGGPNLPAPLIPQRVLFGDVSGDGTADLVYAGAGEVRQCRRKALAWFVLQQVSSGRGGRGILAKWAALWGESAAATVRSRCNMSDDWR